MKKEKALLTLVYTKHPRRSWWATLFHRPLRGDFVEPGQIAELSVVVNRWFRPMAICADPSVAAAFGLVSFTSDGEQQLPSMALSLAIEVAKHQPELVLFDWCAPGREIAMCLRNDSKEPRRLVVALSGDAA